MSDPAEGRELRRISDELAIRNLVAQFANACSPHDLDKFAGLWVPDEDCSPADRATWTLSEPFAMSKTGVADVLAMHKSLAEPWDFFVQLVHSGVVDIGDDGHTAQGRFILREVAKGPKETYYNNFAIYEDAYVKVRGKWFFKRRAYNYMFLDSGPFKGDICPPALAWSAGK